MASRIGMALRNEAAENRIAAALVAIAATGHLDLSPPPDSTRDEVLNDTLRLEWVAESLESVQAVVNALPAKDDAAAEPALVDLTRKELDAIAAELKIEAPEKLPNKSAVVEAIEARRAELAEEESDAETVAEFLDADELATWSRDLLNATAEGQGIDNPAELDTEALIAQLVTIPVQVPVKPDDDVATDEGGK